MGALKINCYCSEKQMNRIVSQIVNEINNSDLNSLSDIDQNIEGVRVCVDFDIYMNTLNLKSAEMLDDDWDTLYEDSAVLTSRLKALLENCNKENKILIQQSRQIRKDQLGELKITSK